MSRFGLLSNVKQTVHQSLGRRKGEVPQKQPRRQRDNRPQKHHRREEKWKIDFPDFENFNLRKKCSQCQGYVHLKIECPRQEVHETKDEFKQKSFDLDAADHNAHKEKDGEFSEQPDHEEVLEIQGALHHVSLFEETYSDSMPSLENCEELAAKEKLLVGKEICQDKLILDSTNEESTMQSLILSNLGSTDESVNALTKRYSLIFTPKSYTLDFKVVEEVDFVFGDLISSKTEHRIKGLLAEVLKSRRNKQMLHFRPSKTESVLDFEEKSLFQEVEHVDFVFRDAAFYKPESKARLFEFMTQGKGEQTPDFKLIIKEWNCPDFSYRKRKHGKFELIMENGIAETFSFDHFLFLNGHKLQDLRMNHIHSPKIGIGTEVQRHDPIVDKVKNGRKVMEPAILEECGVPATSQERSLSLYLENDCRDDTDLRTNLFQVEGDDMIMGSIKKDNQKTDGSFYDEINLFNSMTILNIFSTHQRLTTKWNRFNQSSDEGDIEFTSQMLFSLPDLDQRTFNGGFRANQKELSNEPNCSGILIHSITRENWILIKIGSDLGDMNFSSWMICFRFNLAYRPKNEFHSPTQEFSRHETTWIMLMDLLALQQAQDRKKSPLDHKDTAHLPKRVRLFLYLANSRPNWIVSYQTHVWDPGELSQPKRDCLAQIKHPFRGI